MIITCSSKTIVCDELSDIGKYLTQFNIVAHIN